MENKKTSEGTPVIGEVLKTVKVLETLLKSVGASADEQEKLSTLIDFLSGFRNMTFDQLADELKVKTRKGRTRHSSDAWLLELHDKSLSDLRNPHIRYSLSRRALSELAQRELGLSRAMLMKMSRREMEVTIRRAIENTDTLSSIAKHAATEKP